MIALAVDVFDRTGSGSWVAALLIADFLPTLVLGLLLGPLIDRFSRRRLMIGADLVRLAAFVSLAFAPSASAIVALAGVVGVATGLFRPAVYAGLPGLVDERDLPRANSLFQVGENVTWLLGPLLGGTIVALSSPDVAYLLNAATFLVSAGLLARIPDVLLRVGEPASAGHWSDLLEGIGVVRRSRALLTVLVAWSVVMVGNGFLNVAEVVLAKVSLYAGDFGFGLLAASAGLGLTLGSLGTGGWLDRRPIAEVYGAALALMAVGAAAAAASPSIWLAAASVVVFGVGNGIATVCNPLFVQRGAPDRVRGRAFTVIMSANSAVLGAGMIAAGPLTDAVGARWVWGAAAGVYVLAAAIGLVLARGAARETAPERMSVVPEHVRLDA